MTSALLTAAGSTGAADFSEETWWLVLAKALAIFVFLVVTTLILIWAERRIIGRMQQRPGPNRTGPFGLLQTLADGVKLALKEDIIPKAADKVVYLLAPVIIGMVAFGEPADLFRVTCLVFIIAGMVGLNIASHP